MKRVIRILLAIVIVSALMLTIAACDQDPCKDGHSWDDGSITKQPTCQAEGTILKRCKICGAVEQQTLAKVGHDWGEPNVIVPPTCSTPGRASVKCKNCDETQPDEIIPATGNHVVNLQAKHEAVEATCWREGSIEYYDCQTCGSTVKLDADGNVLTDVKVAKTAHNYDNGVITKAPTCSDTGIKTFTCQNEGCTGDGHTFEQVLDKVDHVYGRLNKRVEPTCDTSGISAYYQCEVCHKYFDESKQETEWTNLVIAALGHNYEKVDGKLATCTQDGFETYYKCNRCHGIFSREGEDTYYPLTNPVPIRAKGHEEKQIPAIEATCTTGGKTAGVECAVCGVILVTPKNTAPLGHQWGEWYEVQHPTCTEQGVMHRDCLRMCGTTDEQTKSIPALGHNYVYTSDNDSVHHTVTCSRDCGYKAVEECASTGAWMSDNADYHYRKCDKCKGECDIANHTFQNKQCTVCGAEQSEVIVRVAGELDHTENSVTAAIEYIKQNYNDGKTPVTIVIGATRSANADVTFDGKIKVTLDLGNFGINMRTFSLIVDEQADVTLVNGTLTGKVQFNGGKLVLSGVSGDYTIALKAGLQCDEADVTVNGTRLDHAWNNGQVTTPPTCEGTGTRTFTCTRCQATRTEDEPAKGHTYGALIPQQDPTCTATGTAAHYQCSDCHKLFIDENGSKKEVQADELVLQKLQHAYGTIHPMEKATCVTDGHKAYYQCESCKQYFDEDKQPTEWKDLVLTSGGHDYDTKNWQSNETSHWYACKNDPTHHDQEATHSWDYRKDTNGSHEHYCTVCGYIDKQDTTCSPAKPAPAESHDSTHGLNIQDGWYADADNHWQICEKCGETINKGAHDWVGEEGNKTCKDCGHKFFDVKISDGDGLDQSAPTIAAAFAWIKSNGDKTKTYTVTLTHNRSDDSAGAVTVPDGYTVVLVLGDYSVTYPNGKLSIGNGSTLTVTSGKGVLNIGTIEYNGGTLVLPAGEYNFKINGTTCDKADITYGGKKVEHNYSFLSDGATQHHEHCSICQHDKGKQNHNWTPWTSTGDTHDRSCPDCGESASEGHNLKARQLTEGDVLHRHELYCEDCDYSVIEDHDFHSGTEDCACGEKLCKEVTDVLDHNALNLNGNSYADNPTSATVNSIKYSIGDLMLSSDAISMRGGNKGHGYIYNTTAFPARILYIELKFVGTNPGVTLYVGAGQNPNSDANKVNLVAVEGAIGTFRWMAKDGENFTYFRLYNGASSQALVSSITIFYQIGTHVWKDAPELHVDPGCETTGKDVRVCERCGKQETTVLDARGHGYDKGFEEIEQQDATCTEQGRVAYYRCKDCGQLFSDAQHSVKIESVDQVGKIPALGHDVQGVTFTDIDGTNHGQKCKRVGCDEYDNISEHVIEQCYDEDNHWQGCKTCGFVQGEKEVHNFGDDGNEIVCRTCGAPNPNHKHVWGTPVGANEPTCTQPGNPAYVQCTSCLHYFSSTEDGAEDYGTKVPVTPAKGHDYTGVEFTPIPGMSQHGKLCKNGCGTYDEQDDHHYTIVGDKVDDAYHTAKCVCGAETQQVHNFKDDQGGWRDKCTCGEERLSTDSITLNRAYLGINTGNMNGGYNETESTKKDEEVEVELGWLHLCANSKEHENVFVFRAASSKKGAIYNTTAMPGKITKIILTYDEGDKSGKSLKLTLGTSKQPSKAYDMTSDGYVFTWEATDKDEFTFFELQGTVGNSATAWVNSIQIFYETCTHTVVDGNVKDQPGCLTPGTKEGTCIRCGKTVTEKVDMLGHNWERVNAEDATCEHPAYVQQWHCTQCDKYYQDFDGNEPLKYMADSSLENEKIVNESVNEGKPLGHEMVWKHDDEKGVHWQECTRYGQDGCTEKTEPTTHDVKDDGTFYYGTDSEGHWRICPTCEWESTEKTGHTDDPCTVCGYTTKSVKVELDGDEPIFVKDLAEALSKAAESGASEITITLLNSISGEGFTYNGEAMIIIDLGGNTYTATSDSSIDGAFMFEICGGTFKGNLTVNSEDADLNDSAILLGNLTVSGGQFSLSEGTSVTGNVNVAGTFILSLNTSVDGQVTVNGGTFTLETNAEVTGKLTVTAGKATVKDSINEVEISGGTLELTENGGVTTLNVKVADSKVNVNIGDKKVTELNIEVTGDAANVTITINGTQQAFGGTITVDSAKCDELSNVKFGSTTISHSYVYENKGDNHDKTCSICNDNITGETHTYVYDSTGAKTDPTHTVKCACGATTTEPHTDEEDGDGYCDVCGYKLPTNYGTIEEPISVEQALKIAADECPNDKNVTKQKVVAKGVVVSIGTTGDYYQNVIIRDEKNVNKTILIYTLNMTVGVDDPDVNDIITIEGYIKNYEGTIEFASNSGEFVCMCANTRGLSTITLGEHGDANVSGFNATEPNGSEVSLVITVPDGKKVTAVKVNDTKIDAESDGKTYKFVVHGDSEITVTTADEGVEPEAKIWKRVTDASKLADGMEITFVIDGDTQIAGKISGTNMQPVNFTITNKQFENLPNNAMKFILKSSGSNWMFTGENGEKLGLTSTSSNNKLNFATNSSNTLWSITLGSDNLATIKNTAGTTNVYLRCYTSGITNCKSNTGGAKDLYIYAHVESSATV